MISPNSIEPLDSINTDLSWNKVTKGVRSSTRRPRKINQSLNIGLMHNDTGNEGHLVAESKEVGAAAPGHHFSEKIDHLPIKKRRCMQQSLPLSPRITYEQKPLVNEKPLCSEDSYGIELLAAAACSNSIDAEFHNANAAKIKANVETRPAHMVCSAEEVSELKDVKVEDHSKGRNSYPVISESIRDKCENETGKSSAAGRDARLHWDLNTVMDEWELSPENISLKCRPEIDNSAEVIKKLEFPDGGTSLGLNPIPSESPFLEKLNTPTTKMAVKVEDHYLSSDLHLGQTLAVENVQLQKQNIDMVESTISESSVCDVAGLKYEEKVKSDGRSSKPLSEKQGIKAPPAVGAPEDSSLKVEMKKMEQKSSGRFDEDALDDSLDDGDVSDYSPSGYHHLVIIEKMSKNNSGYESPVEDGEFREPGHENEGENDCLDFGIRNLCVPEAGSDSNKNMPEKVIFGKSDSEKESSQSVTTGNSAERNPVYKDFVKIVEENEVKLGVVGGFESTKKFEVKGSLEEKQGSRAIRAKSSTHVQRLSGSRVIGGNDIRDVQQSSTSCLKDGQVYRSNKFVRERSIHVGDVAGNWGSKNQYQSNYRRGGGNPGRRSNNGPDSDDDELAYDQRRGSRGGYRPLDRRRSPDDSHDFMNTRNFMTRDERHHKSRGGCRFYRQGCIRDNRNEYHDIVSNDPTVHNHSVYNRDTSFSRPFRKSRSRSRTRSPVPWHLQRERNLEPKRISRSPSFTSEVRMGRNSMHYGESKFSENNYGFLSPSRKQFFNDQNYGPGRFTERESPGRFFGQRQRFGSNGTGGRIKADDGGFRPRYSNTNVERFSEQSGGSWRGHNDSINNDNNYDGCNSERRRYDNKQSGGGWRGNNNNINNDNNYDGSNSEKRRYDNKREMIRRVGHSDAGGADRRFRSNQSDCFEDNNNRNAYNYKSSCIRSSEKSEKGDAGRGFRSNSDDCFEDNNYNRDEFKNKNSFNRSSEKSEKGDAGRGFRSNSDNCFEDNNYNRDEFKNKNSFNRSTEKSETCGADRRFRSNPEDCLEDKNNRNEYNSKNSCIRSTEKCDALVNGNTWKGEKGHLMCDGDMINNTSS